MKRQCKKYIKGALWGIFFMVMSCKSPVPMPNESPGFPSRVEVQFEIVGQGIHGNFTKAREIQIASQSDLNEIYHTINRNLAPKLEPPKIDFSSYWVGFVTLGEKPTGGYAVMVKNVVRSGYQTTVELESTAPDGMTTMAVTSPYVIFKIEKQANAMQFTYIQKY